MRSVGTRPAAARHRVSGAMITRFGSVSAPTLSGVCNTDMTRRYNHVSALGNHTGHFVGACLQAIQRVRQGFTVQSPASRLLQRSAATGRAAARWENYFPQPV